MAARIVTGILIAVVALGLVRSSTGQVQPVPGPGSGLVTVTGKVDVGNVVPVTQSPAGDWKVSVANTPDVRVVNTPTVALSSLPFIKAGTRYEVVWSAGERESVRVVSAGVGAWVRVESSGRPRWLNLAAARAVEEAQ